MKKNQIFFVNQTMTDAANNVVMSNVFSSIYDNANKLTTLKLNIDSLNIDENVAYSYNSETDPEFPSTWQEFQYEEKIPVSFITAIEE